MEKYYKQFDDCRQNEAPFCTDTCPFHVDVLDFETKMEAKRYNAAYKTIRNSVAFPDIVAALCPQYCTENCPADDKIQINLLEKTCTAKAKKKEPTDYNLPARDHKIAVIGGGISGLACALRLASKKFHVTIFEKTDRIGGQLWDRMDPDVFMADIERQFQFEDYTLNLNTEVKDLEELKEFEAVYVATGKGGTDFGIDRLSAEPVVFTGGSLLGKDIMFALADGINIAKSIEAYLKGAKPEYPAERRASRVVVSEDRMVKTTSIKPSEDGVFADEEVAAEIGRCLKCQCDACRQYCDLSAYLDKWPLQMRDEIMTTTMSSESMIHKTPAIRLINMCTQCNLCDDSCPAHIELGKMIRLARKKLHKNGKMPGIYHQFWVRDMEFANGKYAALAKKAPGKETCRYAFFPGCHLGAADPDYVKAPYKQLLKQDPEMGLLLRCCGVPADWAGNEGVHEEQIDQLKKDWIALGKPVLVLACPSCAKHLTEYIPEIQTVFLYEHLEQWGGDWNKTQGTYSVFDPCSARKEGGVQRAVRTLAEQAGASLEELPGGADHGCCGFGGHISIVSPKMAKEVAEKRSGLSENPYITYCINCRDVFRDEGKPVRHILDLLFDIDPGEPDVSQRRNNRVLLKEDLMREIWGEEMNEKPKEREIKLQISPEIREKMNRLKVLEEDVTDVIAYSVKTKRRTFNPETETYKCYREIGHITCWVEYRLRDGVYQVINVYIHRMKIELEAVWNGKKREADM